MYSLCGVLGSLLPHPALNVVRAANHLSWSALVLTLPFLRHSSSSTRGLFYQTFRELFS